MFNGKKRLKSEWIAGVALLVMFGTGLTINGCFKPSNKAYKKSDVVQIPAGKFQMGCISEQEQNCEGDEHPPHWVEISRPFLMMKSEVSQDFYEKVMGKNPSCKKYKDISLIGPNYPVQCVTWYDVIRFANKLSEKDGFEQCYTIGDKRIDPLDIKPYYTGEHTPVQLKSLDCKGWRLPTEAEWEYAAHENQKTKYAGDASLDTVGWYDKNSQNKPHNICQKKENRYGLCDMSGNIWEWIWDWHGSYEKKDSLDPLGPKTGEYRIRRGGSWNEKAQSSRSINRGGAIPHHFTQSMGFRLIRTTQ